MYMYMHMYMHMWILGGAIARGARRQTRNPGFAEICIKKIVVCATRNHNVLEAPIDGWVSIASCERHVDALINVLANYNSSGHHTA